jgi:hypothetical protein
MPTRSMVELQCVRKVQSFWERVGFRPTEGGQRTYTASAGYTHMSSSLRHLKEQLQRQRGQLQGSAQGRSCAR